MVIITTIILLLFYYSYYNAIIITNAINFINTTRILLCRHAARACKVVVHITALGQYFIKPILPFVKPGSPFCDPLYKIRLEY